MLLNINTIILLVVLAVIGIMAFRMGRSRLDGIINISQYTKARNIIKSMLFVPQAIVTTDEKGIIVYANNRSKTGFGWSEDEMKGKSMKLIIPDKYFAAYELFKQNHSGENDSSHLEIECKIKDENLFPVDIMIGKWTDDNDEKNIFFTIVIRNIAHKKANEATVRLAMLEMKKLHNLLVSANKLLTSGAWCWDMAPEDKDHGFGLKPVSDNVECDAGFRHIFGFRIDEKVTAADVMVKVYHKDRHIVNKAIEQCAIDKQQYEIKYRVPQQNGQLDLIRSMGKPEMSVNGKVIKIHGAVILIEKNVPQ